MFSWSNEETFKFIELYQSEPAIWDSNNTFHKDKNKVNDAWNRIADSLQIPVPELKKKKESLMSTFRMHLKKKQDSIRSGIGEEEIYKPIWIFYDVMEAFLKGKYECNSLISTDEQSSSLSLAKKAGIGEQRQEETETPSDTIGSNAETKNMCTEIAVKRRRSAKPPELEKAEKEMSKAFNTLNQVMVNTDQQNKIEDECELYGKLLASKLRKYSENDRQKIMYEIDGLLLRWCCNYSPQYVSSPSQSIISKRPSSSAANYPCPLQSSPHWINHSSSSKSSHNSQHKSEIPSSHNYFISSPIQSPSSIPLMQTSSPRPPTELPIHSYTQEAVYLSPNTVHTPTIHIPEESVQIISDKSHSQTQNRNILTEAYLKAVDYGYKDN